jgi:two-component system, chemotaxis family, protein-glutamate methylesterase/glutaminase
MGGHGRCTIAIWRRFMSTQLPTHTRDIVVIGCSAGGVEALPRITHQLPHDLPASVFIVQHMSVAANTYLVDILQRTTDIRVSWAEQGERFDRSHIYVCPPDVHLVFADHHLRLSRAARENRSRPSIDKLFRSAAAHHGSRTIGVLLTGMLDDGVAGLAAIKDVGGVAIVQDPDDAMFPELPTRALQAIRADHVLPIDAIARSIVERVHDRATEVKIPELIAYEARLDSRATVTAGDLEKLGPQSTIACPECSGPTWIVGGEGARRYRCYLGHVTSARELLDDSVSHVEQALWSAVRALHDRATTLETLASDSLRLGNKQSSQAYSDRAAETRKQADLARQFMLDLGRPK